MKNRSLLLIIFFLTTAHPSFAATNSPATAALCALELMSEPTVMGYLTDRPERGDLFIYEKNVFLIEEIPRVNLLKVRRLDGDLSYTNARPSLEMTIGTPGVRHEVERFAVAGQLDLKTAKRTLYAAPLRSVRVGSVVIAHDLGCPYVVIKLAGAHAELSKLESKDLRYHRKNDVRWMNVIEIGDTKALVEASVVGFFNEEIEEGAAPAVFADWAAFTKAYFTR